MKETLWRNLIKDETYMILNIRVCTGVILFRFGVYNAKSLGVSPALTDADDADL